ncbi:hypothetical protein BLS_002378 [Venturia inaequalis]|uniref:J domain-containing protein n=1 Tax=Venturia inaequalis TaxID=5025 RepID=A0A8H3YK49_VENIN|nr:hypothetical protein BLS_002378 [Venturia inaequalis]
MDHYRRLGIPYDASSSDIGSAYRKAALRHHPDKQSSECEKKKHSLVFLSIKDAYDTLSDPIARISYELEFLPELHKVETREESTQKVAENYVKKSETYEETSSVRPITATHQAGTLESQPGMLEPESVILETESGMLESGLGVLEPEPGILQPETGMPEPEPGNIWDAWADFGSYVFQTKCCFRNINNLWEKHRGLLADPVGEESVRLKLTEACDEIKLHLNDFQKHVVELSQLSEMFYSAVMRDIDKSEDGQRPEHQRMIDEVKASRDSVESWKPWVHVWNKVLAEIVQDNLVCLSTSIADMISRRRGWGQDGVQWVK